MSKRTFQPSNLVRSRRLMQPGIGAVSGELVHVQPGSRTAANIGLYWRYEKWIRKAEARFASTVGATGALYAMRREHYTPLADDTILDDFEQPMLVARQGLRVVFESNAVMTDVQAVSTRVRSGHGTVGALLMDEEIYDDLQEMIRDLKHNPWKFFWRE